MWFKKEEKEVLTIEKLIEFLKSNSERIDNHNVYFKDSSMYNGIATIIDI